MDIASKIKLLKQDVQAIDEESNAINKRIHELKSLVEEKKKKEVRLQELLKMEADLRAELE